MTCHFGDHMMAISVLVVTWSFFYIWLPPILRCWQRQCILIDHCQMSSKFSWYVGVAGSLLQLSCHLGWWMGSWYEGEMLVSPWYLNLFSWFLVGHMTCVMCLLGTLLYKLSPHLGSPSWFLSSWFDWWVSYAWGLSSVWWMGLLAWGETVSWLQFLCNPGDVLLCRSPPFSGLLQLSCHLNLMDGPFGLGAVTLIWLMAL